MVLVVRLERVGARLGLSEALLGLLAALAADTPEITSAVTALVHGQHEISTGVVLGSNVFNLAALLGLGAVVAGRIRLHPRVVIFEGSLALWMAVLSIAAALGLIAPWPPSCSRWPSWRHMCTCRRCNPPAARPSRCRPGCDRQLPERRARPGRRLHGSRRSSSVFPWLRRLGRALAASASPGHLAAPSRAPQRPARAAAQPVRADTPTATDHARRPASGMITAHCRSVSAPAADERP